MMDFDFFAAGVRFNGRAAWPFVMFMRAVGTTKPVRQRYREFDAWTSTDAARYVFTRLTSIYSHSWVYCLNADTQELLALGYEGEVRYDLIDPNHTFDSRGGL